MSVHLDGIVRTIAGRGKPIIDHVSLDIADGEFVALVGPSGAGKTSLLRVIAGLDDHQQGQLVIDDARVDQLSARARNIGFVFQNYALFRHMTVGGNIAFGLTVLPRAKRPSRPQIAARVEELLDLMHLPGMAGTYPARLSGGQRQRVALARALATGPRLLLLDEPFGALDPMIRKSIRTWLRELHERLGLTTILVTHDHQEAIDVADRLAVMRDGRLIQVASPEELERAPAHPFIMDFMGEAVRINGVVRGQHFVPDLSDIQPFRTDAGDGRAELLIRPFEIELRPGMGHGRAIIRHHRNGQALLDVTIGESVIPVLAPSRDVVHAGEASFGLDVSAGRLFRDNQPVGTHFGAEVVRLDARTTYRTDGTFSS